MKNHYLIFTGGRGYHSAVYLLRAPTLLGAIQRFLQEENIAVTFGPDGSVREPYGRRMLTYTHPLAYVEAIYKAHLEWQIRELPEGVWDMDYTEDIFCGENADDIEWHVERCRPFLRREFPRSRAQAFVWYLRDGALVTFYRKKRPFEIEVLGRYLSGDEVTQWTGSYDDLLHQLWVLRFDWAARKTREVPGET